MQRTAIAVSLEVHMQNNFLTADRMKKLTRRLGKETDVDLANEFGITRQRVSQIRNRLGIPIFDKFKFRAGNSEIVSACISKKDFRDMKRALKKIGQRKSEFIRNAIREKIDEVLNG